MKLFFQEAIKTIKTSGTIKSSSKYLVNDCLKDLALAHAENVVEFGTGDGCITEQLAAKMGDSAMLYSFEINPTFYTHSHNKFYSHENIQILNRSALDFDAFLAASNIQKVDYIISSLPLTFFNKADIQLLLSKVQKHLKKGGLFIQYQYSLSSYKILKATFQEVNIDLTIRNLPPAFIYKCNNG